MQYIFLTLSYEKIAKIVWDYKDFLLDLQSEWAKTGR